MQKVFYKIYNEDMVVDVNHLFFFYEEKYGRIIECPFKHAQLISDSKGTKFYTTDWLCPLDVHVPGVTSVKAAKISEEEYKKLYEELQLGKTIVEVEEPIEAATLNDENVSTPETEKVMTVSEMRNKINELEEIIKTLLSKF